MLSITRWPWSSPLIYCLPGPAWASTEGKWSMCCCSWPRLHLWNLRPGSKCCQKIGHRGARAREYPSFPSSCSHEMFWWEVYMEMKGYFRAQFRSAVNHCGDLKAGTWCSWLRALQSTERMHACLPACQCPAHLLPFFCHPGPKPREQCCCSGLSLSSGISLWRQAPVEMSTRLEYSSFPRWFQVIVDCVYSTVWTNHPRWDEIKTQNKRLQK